MRDVMYQVLPGLQNSKFWQNLTKRAQNESNTNRQLIQFQSEYTN